MRRLIDLARNLGREEIPVIDEVYIASEDGTFLLTEGKLVSGRFDRNIRIDPANYGAGKRHAHVLGRKGNEVGVVNFDGTGSHGTKFKLHPKDADVLRAHGFQIRDDLIIEWISLGEPGLQFLAG